MGMLESDLDEARRAKACKQTEDLENQLKQVLDLFWGNQMMHYEKFTIGFQCTHTFFQCLAHESQTNENVSPPFLMQSLTFHYVELVYLELTSPD